MKKTPRTFLAAVALVAPMLAMAQTASTPRIDQRQANQETRIQQGEQSGALTQREGNKLERGQQHVQNMENKAMADGTVTKKEAGRIEHAQNEQSRKIERQKHDRQHDYNHDGKNDHRQRKQH